MPIPITIQGRRGLFTPAEEIDSGEQRPVMPWERYGPSKIFDMFGVVGGDAEEAAAHDSAERAYDFNQAASQLGQRRDLGPQYATESDAEEIYRPLWRRWFPKEEALVESSENKQEGQDDAAMIRAAAQIASAQIRGEGTRQGIKPIEEKLLDSIKRARDLGDNSTADILQKSLEHRAGLDRPDERLKLADALEKSARAIDAKIADAEGNRAGEFAAGRGNTNRFDYLKFGGKADSLRNHRDELLRQSAELRASLTNAPSFGTNSFPLMSDSTNAPGTNFFRYKGFTGRLLKP